MQFNSHFSFFFLFKSWVLIPSPLKIISGKSFIAIKRIETGDRWEANKANLESIFNQKIFLES